MWTQDNGKYPENLMLELVCLFLTLLFLVFTLDSVALQARVYLKALVNGGERFLCS